MTLRFQAWPAWWVLVAVGLFGLMLAPPSATAQTYTLPPAEALSTRPLDEALLTLQHTTGIDLFYDPALVQGKQTGVVRPEDDSLESILRALLAGTDLSFYRLSTGTYALRDASSTTPMHGGLEGYVLDLETGTPLPEANVLLANLLHRGDATNASGIFRFAKLPAGRYIVFVSHVGYTSHADTVEVYPYERSRLRVGLRKRIELIAPLIVEDVRDTDDPRALGTTLLQENLTRVSGPGSVDPVRSLNVLSGVRVSDALADVHIQGGEAGEHQFRLDGVPIFEPVHLRGLIGAFNPFALDRIEVHKAGFSATQGSYLAGVIDARHALGDAGRRPIDVQVDPLSFNTRMSLSVGPSDGIRASAMVAYRRSVWDVYSPARVDSLLHAWNTPDPFLLSASIIALRENLLPVQRDFYLNQLDSLSEVAALPDLEFNDIHAAGQVRFPGGHTLYSSYYRSGNQLNDRRLVTAFDSTARDQSNPDLYAWVNENAQLRWSGLLTANLFATARLWSSRYELEHEYTALGNSTRIPFVEEGLQVTLQIAPADDGNRIREAAFASSLQYFHGRGTFRLDAEANHVRHRFLLDDAFTQRIEHNEDNWRVSVTAEERLNLSDRWTATGGARMTFLNAHGSVYAEPRLDVRYTQPETPIGALTVRAAAGLYRQFVNQFDISNISPSTLFPAVRFWMPVDSTVRPPKAYHLAADMIVQPSEAWRLHLEGYYKNQPHLLQIDYPAIFRRDPEEDVAAVTTQREFLRSSNGYAYGAAVGVEHTRATTRTSVRYEYNLARREYDFQNIRRREAVPWSEPHRLEVAFDWTPHPHFVAIARWRSGWGRIWGFRRAYYDFFGTTPARQSVYGTFDFKDPAAHELRAFHQLDLGAAYMYSLGPAVLQLRLDLLNALDRSNVADLSLINVDNNETTRLFAQERYLLARSLALSIRLQW